MPSVEDIMIADAKKHLVPMLKKVMPVDSGDLRKSIDVGKYSGRNRRDADQNNYYMVGRIRLWDQDVSHTIVYGALGPARRSGAWQPPLYGHVQFQTNDVFRRKWIRTAKKYEKEFVPRILNTMLGGN